MQKTCDTGRIHTLLDTSLSACASYLHLYADLFIAGNETELVLRTNENSHIFSAVIHHTRNEQITFSILLY
jgi:hypothetical protein